PVAVYSEADSSSLHVRLADEAYKIGPAPSSESYLKIDNLLEAAMRSGADGVHPGYGFLAENAQFARAVIDAGLVFVGPPASAIELMGSKISARRIAKESGVAVVPGTTDPVKSVEDARRAAQSFGYPVMLKAAAGGGGKGMRLVASEEELEASFQLAATESAAAFGDSQIYLEKAIIRPRHIEIQVFADTHGNVVHLGERECSIQRRHQKLVEECPSPISDLDLRTQMGEAAIKIARAVGYVGAGTVEFLVTENPREFYFLEMNTRLQVEHAVTELVTDIDLVCEQLKVASGAPLSFTQHNISWRGHAIECRVYAEDPDQDFMPSPGIISALHVPDGVGVRNDGSAYSGMEVSLYYDPMISKLAVWGSSRAEAINRMRRALDEYHIGGIKTTLGFLRRLIRDEKFARGTLNTGFIEDFNERSAHRTISTDYDQQREADLAIVAAGLAYA
ncbi:MAG: acetyl-CoA carboxylase biotin carboxylase subunit, partial [Pyrinomonadaceae bacterium]